MADEKKTVILEFEVDIDQSVESINKLTAANKELRKERNELNIATESGKKRAQEINAIIDQNTGKIKANVSAIEQQKINIGNYRSALDGVHPALGRIGQGLESGAQGFKAMTAQALAFIATPIGAIIAALVVAFKLLSTFVQNSAVGMDKFEDITAAVSAVVDVVTDRIVKFVGALGDLLSGDITKGLKGMEESFSGIGDEIEREINAAVELAGAIRDLEDREIDYSIAVGETENAIKRLILQSKNRSLTEEQRIKKLEEAAELEKKQNEENLAIEEERLRIANDSANQRLGLARQVGETEIEFGKRIVEAFKAGKAQADDLRDAVVESIIKRQAAESESFNLLEKIENQKQALAERAEAAREKALKDREREIQLLKQQAEEERALQRAQSGIPEDAIELPGEIEAQEALTEAFSTQIEIRTNLAQQLADDVAKINDKARAEEEAALRKQADIAKSIKEDEFNAAMAVTDGILGLLDRQSEEYKAIATAQTLISTYAAAAKAYEAAFLPIPTVASPALGVAFAAAAVLQGLARVAAINQVEFAEGGIVLQGPSHAQGGIPIVAEGNEIILTKGVYNNPKLRAQASALNVAGGGRSFADGGIVTRSISQPIDQNFDVLNIVRNMPEPVVSVKEINKVQKSVKVKENISKR